MDDEALQVTYSQICGEISKPFQASDETDITCTKSVQLAQVGTPLKWQLVSRDF